MKELQSASEASVSAVSGESTAAAETDDDASQSATNITLFDKYAPVIAKFKVSGWTQS